MVTARWFPARGRRAVVLLPHWNSDALSYIGLCRVFNLLGIAVLRMSMPYHDSRKPPEIQRADYAVSANIGRTLNAVRQGVIDVRCCLDWLEQQGYNRLELWGRASAPASRSSLRRMIRASGWLPSIMRPLTSLT